MFGSALGVLEPDFKQVVLTVTFAICLGFDQKFCGILAGFP